MDLFSDSDMVNPLLKTNERRDRRLNFVIFVVSSALIIDKWWVVAWGENSCFGLTKVSSLMFVVLFKDGTQDESSGGKDAVIISGACYNATKLK